MRNIHQRTCSVIPQHMLQHLATHGDADARKNVEATMRQTVQIVQERSAATIRAPGVPSAADKRRAVYDARHGRDLPGTLVLNDPRAVSNDIEAREAFEGSGATYDFFDKGFFRNSIDGRGMPLVSTIHYGRKFCNAMWDGRQMIFGDGDGKLFNRFTAALDVIAHELTHGVTQYSAGLDYSGQSGALNEHISDAFGIMIKQQALGLIASQSDWLIGVGLLGPDVRGHAIRSMKAPGTAYDDPALGRDPQPAHMRDYVDSADDDGGVHINSGIPNHAFYQASNEIGGVVWPVMGRIWYRVVTAKLFPHAGFQDFAMATVTTAGELFGIGGAIQAALFNAWSRVGLPVPASLLRRTQSLRNGTRRDGPTPRQLG